MVSRTKLGRVCTNGLRTLSTNAEIFSVGDPTAEMIGRPGLFLLCILGSRYRVGVRGNL